MGLLYVLLLLCLHVVKSTIQSENSGVGGGQRARTQCTVRTSVPYRTHTHSPGAPFFHVVVTVHSPLFLPLFRTHAAHYYFQSHIPFSKKRHNDAHSPHERRTRYGEAPLTQVPLSLFFLVRSLSLCARHTRRGERRTRRISRLSTAHADSLAVCRCDVDEIIFLCLGEICN